MRKMMRTSKRTVRDQYARLVEIPIKTGIPSFDDRCQSLFTGEARASTQFSAVIPLRSAKQYYSDPEGAYTARVLRQFRAFDVPEDVLQQLQAFVVKQRIIVHCFFMKVHYDFRLIGVLAFDLITADCCLTYVGDPRAELRYAVVLDRCRAALQRAMRKTDWTMPTADGKTEVSISVFKRYVRSLGYAVSRLDDPVPTYWIHERNRQTYLLMEPADPSDVCRLRLDQWLRTHTVKQPVSVDGKVVFIPIQIV